LRRVLVTGAAGFLGRYVARQLSGEGWEVLGIDRVAPPGAPCAGEKFVPVELPGAGFRDLLRSQQPEALIHCAGSASVPHSMRDPADDYRANTVLTFDLLDALRLDAPRCAFLLLSSAAVYGNPVSLPVRETDALLPLSPYGYHKRQAEELCAEFARIYGLPAASARIFSAYGPGLRRQVVWDICAKALRGGPLRLQGTGGETRDFIHATDVARGLHTILSASPLQGDVYNLSSGREVSIAELAVQLMENLGARTALEFDGVNTPGNPLQWRADIGKIRALGFEPAVSLEAGLQEVANWCAQETSAGGGE
jgi:UDP-glucose 4-epimerase